jgi:predicted amidohydrolase
MRKRSCHSIASAGLVLVAMLLAAPCTLMALEHEVVVGVYQGPCRDGDFSANLAIARQAIAEARAAGSQFLALPEAFLSGCDTFEHLKQGARRTDDPELKTFIAETAAHDLVVLAGMTRIEKEGMYNSVLVIQKGKILGIYDKVMLVENEAREYGILPGKTVPVFTAHGARFAVILCHDTSFPQPAMMARLQGAEILFTPHYNCIPTDRMDDHRKWVRNTHIGLACQMKMVMARANVVITDKKDRLGYGDSFIMSPKGETLAEAGLFRTKVVTARVTPAMFRPPAAWADLGEVPPEFNARLGELLQGTGKRR